jgi:hypothetical protein
MLDITKDNQHSWIIDAEKCDQRKQILICIVCCIDADSITVFFIVFPHDSGHKNQIDCLVVLFNVKIGI